MQGAALADICRGEPAPHAKSCGLWTKCGSVFADYFLKNWSRRREPLAFLLYDPPPALPAGAPVFIHSDKTFASSPAFEPASSWPGTSLLSRRTSPATERD